MKDKVNLLQGNIYLGIAKLSIPLMFMSFIQMAYNLTDMFWIGKLGSGPIAAVGTGGLIMWLSTGIHMLAQLGGQVYLAQNIGAKKFELASKFAQAAFWLSATIGIIIGLISVIFINPIISFFNLNSQEVIYQAKVYVMVACGCIVFMLLSKLLTSLITTTGDSKTPLIATTIGLVFNIIIDPIFIFGYLGLPKMGVLGAALATVLAQIIVFSILFIYALKDKLLFANIDLFKIPELEICKKIIKLGAPVALQYSLFPLISMYISRLVASFGDYAVAAQRIGAQVESITWNTSEGFAIAVNSFIAQNYGATNNKRAKEGFYKSLGMLTAFSIFSTLLLIFCAKEIFSIFIQEDVTLLIGTGYLAIVGFSQIPMCWEILCNNAMNAIGKTTLPATINIIFTALRIPLAHFLITTSLQLNGIWWAISISTMLKGGLLIIGAMYFINKIAKK